MSSSHADIAPMDWTDELNDRLADKIPCGYLPSGPASTEPTALAALLLTSTGKLEAAAKATEWLARLQNADGSIGTTATRGTPNWPTAWAVLAATAWRAAQNNSDKTNGRESKQDFNLDGAVSWLLHAAGEAMPATSGIGHNAALTGWPWVADTHSWVEPSAMAVLALKAAGYAEHPRTREAVLLLTDRLLSGGGCNYGNTIVLGQELLPHVQPTGLALLALAGEADRDGRINRSLDYLSAVLSAKTTSASLAYGLLGLAAHGRFPAYANRFLDPAYQRTLRRDGAAYQLALLGLAAQGLDSPLVALPAQGAKHRAGVATLKNS
jgi:hypothetical protein